MSRGRGRQRRRRVAHPSAVGARRDDQRHQGGGGDRGRSWPRMCSGRRSAPIARSPIAPIAIRPAAVSAADPRRAAGRAARIPRAAGRAARSRAHPRADRPLARRHDTGGRRAFRRSRAIRRRRSHTSGRRCGRTGRPIIWACRRTHRSPPGCSSSSSRSRARRADPAPNDETHHRLPDGTTLHVSIWNMPEAKRRSGFAALRLPQNEGWTNWLVGQDASIETVNLRTEYGRRDLGSL